MGNNKNNNEAIKKTANQITASVLILSVILSFTLGLIGGYLIGEKRTETRISDAAISSIGIGNNNPQNTPGTTPDSNSTNEPVESIDYSKYVINAKKGLTVENYYTDAETKQYASMLIGMSMPEFSWVDTAGTTHKNSDFTSNYIIEIFSPSCGYCNQSAPEVDKYREAHPDIPVVSLTTIKGQDISNFNAAGENAFIVDSLTSEANSMLNYVPWIPAFIYVKDGKIALVTYGGVQQTDIETQADIAFNQ